MASEKRYELRASAMRAAKKAGLTEGQFDVEQVWEGEGKSYWRWTAKPVAPTTGQDDEKSTTAAPESKVEATVETAAPVDTGAPATTVDTATPKPVKGDNVKPSKSTVENPVQVVHQLVAEMVKANPQVRRKDLVDAAIKAGCAYYTARTQVQVALKKVRS
jgi:hypothetical protein